MEVASGVCVVNPMILRDDGPSQTLLGVLSYIVRREASVRDV